MSRSGYYEDIDDMWAHIRYRGAVTSAIRGKRGQSFLKEMLASLDALPEKKLVRNELEHAGQVCAIGSVGRARGINMSGIDPEDPSTVANVFGINEKMVREIVYVNDEDWYANDSDEERFRRVRAWVVANIIPDSPSN